MPPSLALREDERHVLSAVQSGHADKTGCCLVLGGSLSGVRLACFSQTNPGRKEQIESHNRQAAEYLRQNRPDLAVPEFKAIVALDPNNVDARGNLGVVLFFQGDYTSAIPQLRAALKLRPSLSKIQALLGIAEKRTGDIKAARGDLEKSVSKRGGKEDSG